MKIFGFLTVLGAVYGQGYGNGGNDNKVKFEISYREKFGFPSEKSDFDSQPILSHKSNFFIERFFYQNEP